MMIKGENASLLAFLLFSTLFFPVSDTNTIIRCTFNLLSAIAFKSLPNNEICTWIQIVCLNTSNEVKLTQKPDFVPERVESNVGTGENAGCQHFLLFPH